MAVIIAAYYAVIKLILWRIEKNSELYQLSVFSRKVRLLSESAARRWHEKDWRHLASDVRDAYLRSRAVDGVWDSDRFYWYDRADRIPFEGRTEGELIEVIREIESKAVMEAGGNGV